MSKRRSGAAGEGESKEAGPAKAPFARGAERTAVGNLQLVSLLTGEYLSQRDRAAAAQASRLWRGARLANNATAIRKGLAWVDAFERDFARLKRDFQRFEESKFQTALLPAPLFGAPPTEDNPDGVAPPARLTMEEVELFLRAPQGPLALSPDIEDDDYEPPPHLTTPWAHAMDFMRGGRDHGRMADVCQAWGPWAAFAHAAKTDGYVGSPVQTMVRSTLLANGLPALARFALLDSVACATAIRGTDRFTADYQLAGVAVCDLLDLDRRSMINYASEEICRVLHDTLFIAKMPGMRLPRADRVRDRIRQIVHDEQHPILNIWRDPGASALTPAQLQVVPPPTEAVQVNFAVAVSQLRAHLAPAP